LCPPCSVGGEHEGPLGMPTAKGKAKEEKAGYNQGKFFRRKKELTEDQLTEIQDSFDLFAKETDTIDAEELLVVMRALGHEPAAADLKRLVNLSDKNNTGQLDFDGYLNIILTKMAERPSEADLQKAFRLFDSNSKGTVDQADLRRIADQIGENIEDDELADMIYYADTSGSSQIGPEDFVKIVTTYAKHYDGEK